MHFNDLYQRYIQYPKVTTDSRMAGEKNIFFALKGDNFDGNDFAARALDDGCTYAVVDRPDVATDDRCILVDDVLTTLQDLARVHRQKLDIPIIAITGTNGKTTTKELVKHVLSSKFRVHATSGNFNNHIGVPLSILDISQQTEIAVIEMGANHQGEIKNLCNIALPTHGLITNIGKAHLEGFGGEDGVKRAKKELYDHLESHNGLIFFNETNPVLTNMLKDIHTTVVGYGAESSVCHGKVVAASPYLLMELDINNQSHEVATHLAGAYNFENVLAAACIGSYFGIPSDMIVSSIAGYEPQNNRSQIIQTTRNQLLLDYYNANPTSMRESLFNFFERIQGPKLAILGDMFELGDAAKKEHRLIIDLLLAHPDIESMVAGKYFFDAAKGIPGIRAFADLDVLKQWLILHQPQGKTILVKGSRGMKMEQLLEHL